MIVSASGPQVGRPASGVLTQTTAARSYPLFLTGPGEIPRRRATTPLGEPHERRP